SQAPTMIGSNTVMETLRSQNRTRAADNAAAPWKNSSSGSKRSFNECGTSIAMGKLTALPTPACRQAVSHRQRLAHRLQPPLSHESFDVPQNVVGDRKIYAILSCQPNYVLPRITKALRH